MAHVVGGRSGWLRTKLEPSGIEVSLPEYLKVDITESKDGREYFTILEGVHKGKKASVKLSADGSSNLGTMAMYRGAAKLVFNIAKGEVTYGGGVAKAITHPDSPTPKGTHPIQIPDYPHRAGDTYLSTTPYTLSWFFLGVGNAVTNSSDRYLHTGTRSLGCVTVNPDEWTKLYKHLILSRTGDDRNVGTITVV